MGYPKKHRGRRKIGSKKRRARKREIVNFQTTIKLLYT